MIDDRSCDLAETIETCTASIETAPAVTLMAAMNHVIAFGAAVDIGPGLTAASSRSHIATARQTIVDINRASTVSGTTDDRLSGCQCVWKLCAEVQQR